MPRATTKPTKLKMLATHVAPDVAADFDQIAKSHNRSVAGELRQIVLEHIAAKSIEVNGNPS